MELSVVGWQGESAAQVEVSDRVFACRYNSGLVHQVVTAFMARGRQNSRLLKSRSDVRGSGRKPWRQKGTGRSRAGTIGSPLWRGGGVSFPNNDRNFSQKINRKMYRGAMRVLLSELLRHRRLVVADEISVPEAKTRALHKLLDAREWRDVLLVTLETDEALERAAGNLPRVEVRTAARVDPLCLLGRERAVFSLPALQYLEQRLSA